MSYLNKPVLVGGERGTVTGEFSKKGKLRLVVTFADGTSREVGYGLVKLDEVCGPAAEFAPAESWNKIVREGAAEDRRRALRNIGEI